MYSQQDYDGLERRFLSESADYSVRNSYSQGGLARALLICTANLRYIRTFNHQVNGHWIENRHTFQDTYFMKGTNALLAVYRLVKHGLYDSAYRDMRYLYETTLAMRGLNREKGHAATLAENLIEELEFLRDVTGSDEFSQWEFAYIDDIHEIIRAERKRLKNRPNVMGEDLEKWLYGYLSNRSMHPVRIDGSLNDERGSSFEADQLLRFSLSFAFGLGNEYWKTYNDTPASLQLYRMVHQVAQEIRPCLPQGLPAFLIG